MRRLAASQTGRDGLARAAENVIVTAGAKPALIDAMRVLLEPGDEVLVLSPHWPTYCDQARAAGRRPRDRAARPGPARRSSGRGCRRPADASAHRELAEQPDGARAAPRAPRIACRRGAPALPLGARGPGVRRPDLWRARADLAGGRAGPRRAVGRGRELLQALLDDGVAARRRRRAGGRRRGADRSREHLDDAPELGRAARGSRGVSPKRAAGSRSSALATGGATSSRSRP